VYVYVDDSHLNRVDPSGLTIEGAWLGFLLMTTLMPGVSASSGHDPVNTVETALSLTANRTGALRD
jgi:hypothetical protein